MHKRLILTAASPSFERSLLALIGSLNVNWPDHPEIQVFDLGMGQETIDILASANIEVRKVPPFCGHWRKHFTWKIWCCHNAECDSYLWLDAGICVLRPMEEAFSMIEHLGYFCQVNGYTLDQSTPSYLMDTFGLSLNGLSEMLSINGGLHGLLKNEVGENLLSEAMRLALDENNMMATQPLHRHDQSLLSILFYKYFKEILFADMQLYAGFRSPTELKGQRAWQHRRRMLAKDMDYFIAHVNEPGKPHFPSALPQETVEANNISAIKRLRIKVAKLRGRYPISDSEERTSENWVYDGTRD